MAMSDKRIEGRRLKVSLGTVLLYLAAAFQSTQYARAFHVIDPDSPWSDASGILAGVVVNVSLAYAASRLPKLRAKKARQFSYAAFIALLVLTPLFVAPINYKTMGALWNESWLLKALLAVVSASLVDIAIVLVAFADGALMPESASQSEDSATESAKGASGVRRSAKKSAKETSQSVAVRRTYPRKCDHCDAQIVSPNAVGAHMKKHHPELCKPKVLAENFFENVKVQP
jgi:MFS family permease